MHICNILFAVSVWRFGRNCLIYIIMYAFGCSAAEISQFLGCKNIVGFIMVTYIKNIAILPPILYVFID